MESAADAPKGEEVLPKLKSLLTTAAHIDIFQAALPDRVTRRYRVSCQIIKRCKPDDPVTLKARLCDLFFNVYFSIVKMRAEGGKLMSWRHTNIDQKCRRCTHPSPNIWNCKHSRNALCKDNNKTKKKKADRRLKSIWLKKKVTEKFSVIFQCQEITISRNKAGRRNEIWKKILPGILEFRNKENTFLCRFPTWKKESKQSLGVLR